MAQQTGLCSLELWRNGPRPGAFYNFPGDTNASDSSTSMKRTLYPTVTGSSVLGMVFKDGVIIAADMLGSYGSLARYKNCPRLFKVNETSVVGAGGDYADFQYLKAIIEQRVIDEACFDDGFQYTPSSLFSWLTRVLYNRRTRCDPLWNTFIVGGMEKEKPFLGYVDKIGIAYTAPTVACGYAAYIAQPVMRNAYEKNPNMTEKEAIDVLTSCLTLLHYRDARSLNKYQFGVVTKAGSEIRGPFSAKTDWSIAHCVSGYD